MQLYKDQLVKNRYLRTATRLFYSCPYYHMRSSNPDHPLFLNHLKNDICSTRRDCLIDAQQKLRECLHGALSELIIEIRDELSKDEKLLVCLVPRAQQERNYRPEQLLFKEILREVLVGRSEVEDGIECIKRVKDTPTTHRKNNNGIAIDPQVCAPQPDGVEGKPGFTLRSCEISDQVRGRTILLVDDVYTRDINIDEDAIQALYDSGAKDVLLYVVGYTQKRCNTQIMR